MKKKKKATVRPLPPLSFEVLKNVQQIEGYAAQELDACCDLRSGELNTEKVGRIARTCVVEVLDAMLCYYKSLPNFKERWVREMRESAINSVVGMIPTGYEDHVYDEFYTLLAHTTYDHLNPLKPKKVTTPKPVSREAMRHAYLEKFPGTQILDICWAAGQHYSEWKRWLRNAVKDGSAPDRAFRAILTSGRTPAEYRKAGRPPGWK